MTFEKVKKLLAEQLNIAEEKITMDSDIINDFKADSLDVFQMLMMLEEGLAYPFPTKRRRSSKKSPT